MAYISKKKKAETMPCSKYFYVGIYARISVDNSEDKKDSIDTQIAIAKQYLEEHPEMELYDCYTDLGRSGTNFKREGFERMMQDVRKKRINCVIVKDLSRFGRNHIETGNYIQKIFPFMGVRFLALTDGVDTFEQKSGADEMTVNLKNLVNEMYARDIAEKVRSSRRSSQEQGSYTGGLPPYGYRAEWVNGKKCLFICLQTSGIVKNIYELFLSGKNMRQIARVLYEQGIHRPSDYRKTGYVYRQEGEALKQWSIGTIKFILTNPVYIGCRVGTIYGKQYKLKSHYDIEKQYKPRNRHDIDSENRNRIQHNIYEPIIREEVFFQVAAIFEKSAEKYCNADNFSKKVPIEEDIYAGVLFCGDCGKQMARTANIKKLGSGTMVRHYGYYCPCSRRLDDFECPTKSIGISALNQLVKTALYQEFALSDLCPGRLIKECERQAAQTGQWIRQEIVKCEKQKESRRGRGSELYIKYHTGSISLEKFQQLKKENEILLQEISKKKTDLMYKLDSMEQELKERGKFLQNLMECSKKIKLTKDIIHTLIDRIDIYAGQRIKITFAFQTNELLIKK